jgi:serine/threonine protein kinase
VGTSVYRSEGLKGAHFGPYEIVGLIGHGATASVFEAKHVDLGKSVAIKMLHPHLGSDEQVSGRFVREGRVAARLTHPNAVGVTDVGVEDGVPYLVMELLHGADLRALLADAAPLSTEHALAFLLPIASALQHAHEAGVLHRDLKPANIFLSRDVRDDIVPKLLDFGLSKVVTGPPASALTQAELVAGTALYMAPEQTLGVRYCSAASDQYSLAAMLYECVTGVPPFAAAGSVYEILERVRTMKPRAPSALCPRIPLALEGAILRAMAPDPEARYESVRAFARDLLPYADETTHRALERDFVEKGADSGATLASRPSIRRASARQSAAVAIGTRAESRGSVSSRRATASLPCAAGASPFRIKGVFYKGFVTRLTATVGLDVFVEKLTDEGLRAFIRQPFLATARYDILPFVPLHGALARHLGVSLEELVRTLAAAQASYDATHVYKTIFDAHRPEDLADRFARFNAQVYDFGRFTGRLVEPKRIVLDYEEIPAFIGPWFGPMHIAYALESMRMCGAENVTVAARQQRDGGTRKGFPLVSYRTELLWS